MRATCRLVLSSKETFRYALPTRARFYCIGSAGTTLPRTLPKSPVSLAHRFEHACLFARATLQDHHLAARVMQQPVEAGRGGLGAAVHLGWIAVAWEDLGDEEAWHGVGGR